MKILDYDEAIFEKGIVKETEKLTGELHSQEVDSSRGDDLIFGAHEEYRKAQVVQASYTVIRDAGLLLDKLIREKRNLKVQADLRRNEIFRRLEEINSPLVEYIASCADEGIRRLQTTIIFKRSGIEKNSFTDKRVTPVLTNFEIISLVRESLLGFKAEIRSMIHSAGAEIQAVVQSFSEAINLVDLKKVEEISMSPEAAREFEDSLKGTSSGAPPPQFPISHIGPAPDPVSNFLEGRWNKLKEAVGFQSGVYADKLSKPKRASS